MNIVDRKVWLGVLVLVSVVSQALAETPLGELRVMSFNVRTSTAKDGPNAWPLRREMMVRTIEAFDPDLLGVQECQPDQRDALREALGAKYDWVGIPRDDGKTRGEIAAVVFRRERFEKLREGHFWLSETPEVVGSKGWDAAITRTVSWVELKDRRRDGDGRLFVFNTHFDHKGPQARLESAKLLRKRIEQITREAPVIVTGDFNARETSEPYRALLAGEMLYDTFPDVHKTPTTQDFTFHGFTGKNEGGRRIDWVLRSRHFETISAGIDKTNEQGRYPSDHFPVTATLRWRSSGTGE